MGCSILFSISLRNNKNTNAKIALNKSSDAFTFFKTYSETAFKLTHTLYNSNSLLFAQEDRECCLFCVIWSRHFVASSMINELDSALDLHPPVCYPADHHQVHDKVCYSIPIAHHDGICRSQIGLSLKHISWIHIVQDTVPTTDIWLPVLCLALCSDKSHALKTSSLLFG